MRSSSRALWLIAALGVGCSGALPAPGTFEDAVAFAATPDGRLWVVDGGAAAVVVLRGGFEDARLGGVGTGEGAFLDPVDVDPTNGLAIFVADRAAGTVLQFTDEFRLALEVVVPDVDPTRPVRQTAGAVRDGNRGQPLAVAAAPDGVLFVLDGGRRHVLQMSSEGDVQRVLGAGLLVDPVDLALGDDGTLWVVDRGRDVVQPFDAFGSAGDALEVTGVGPLASVSVSGGGVVVGAERGVGRLRGAVIDSNPFQPLVGMIRGALEVGGRVVVLTPSGVVETDLTLRDSQLD
ncbi:hypothetical protein [Rubrivirga sp.]|uniref:hypothetical protein n=1 Tax=Rubrivirga sp. TaxID=1885344 RepID=UPI003C721976